MEFVHVFEGGDEPVFVKERDLAEYRKRFSKSEESLAFDVDGKPVFVRARDVGAFKQKHGGKAEPAFGVEVDGEPVFVRERDRAAFAKKMGSAARAKAEAAPASGFDTPWQGFKEGALRGARDVGLSAAKGVASVPGAVVGVADLVTAPLQARLSKLAYGEAQTGLIGGVVEEATELLAPGLNRVGSTLDAAHSEEFKADREKVNAAEGFKGTAAAILKNPHVAGSTVVESVAPMLLGGGIGNRLAKAAPKLAGVAGSIGEGLAAGGSLQEQFRAGRGSGTTTPAQSALAAGAGLATGAIGAASNRLGSLVGASDVEAVAAGVAKRGVKAATRAERALRGIAGVGMEAAEEMLQEPGEGIAENLGTGRPWDEGLKNRAVQGGVAGAAMGLGANVDLRRGPVAERVAAARREGTPDPLLEDSEAGKAARLAAMRANRPTPPPEMPPEMPPTMPQDGPAAPPPVIVEIDGKPHEVVAENPAAQTATVVSEMGEVKQVPLSMVPPMPENVVGAPPPEAPELGEVVPDADGTGQRATLVSAPMFLPPATAPEMIALPEPVPPVLPDAPEVVVPDAPPAPPPAMVETPPRAETPEMPPPVAAGELPSAENVTRTKKPAVLSEAGKALEEILYTERPTVELPVKDIAVQSPGFEQFKQDADPKTGEVSGQELKGRVVDLDAKPIVVLMRLDGSLVVVTGRHRLGLYKRNGRTTIPAKVLYEAEGVTPTVAHAIDAISNILDEKGTINDYVRFFDETQISDDEAQPLLDRPSPRAAYSIYRDSSQVTRDAVDWEGEGRNGISAEQAAIISRNAPISQNQGFAGAQVLGVKAARNGMKGKLLDGYMQAIVRNELMRQRNKAAGAAPQAMDLFAGTQWDIGDAESIAAKEAKYTSGKASEYATLRSVLSSAMKKAGRLVLTDSQAQELGITDKADKAQIAAAWQKAKELADYWSKGNLDVDDIIEMRKALGLSTEGLVPSQDFALNSPTEAQLDAEQASARNARTLAALQADREGPGRMLDMEQAGLPGIGTDTPLFNQPAATVETPPRAAEGGARFSPAEGEGGGVETAARAPAPGASSARRGTPQGVAGGKLNGKPRIGLRLGDVVEMAVALANGKAPRVVERIRGLGGRAAGAFKSNADGTASIDIRADQALVVGTGERAALMAETSEQVQAELGDRPGVEDAEGRANWDERAREVFKEKLDEAFARNVQDDPEQAMKVLAHEVGHWVDWLPDNTLKRGNVFGHIAALKGFLFGKLGLTPDQQLTAAQIEELRGRALEEAGGGAKKARSIFARLKSKAEAGSEMARLPVVKSELEKLIAWYNNSETMPEYYREPAEMFAEAFSAWVNYPAEVAARAPIFNSLVEEWIAARPEAYAHYAAIQKKLETPGMSEGEQVRKLEEGFERSRRDAELAARARERVGGAELSDRVLAFFHRTMDPIYRRVARLKDTARAAETLKALADQRYWGADAERITTKVGERVVKRLQAAGVSITRFNTFLAMRRIANEGVNTMVDEQRKRGRANLFNPFGFTPRSAGAWLKAHGEKFPESLAAMETAAGELVAIRREVLFPILKASGAVSEKTYEMLLENWAYAKFKVNQHGELKSALERMMGVGEGGSGLKTQRGTLREIGGPLENTVLADIAMARWALTQNANWRAIQDIMATTPEDVKELRPQWVAGKPVWRDVNTPRVKTVHVTRLGVDHAFAVPTAIARALGKRGDESVVSVLAARMVQGQARLLTTWNLGFALRNPFRDYQRAARLLPGWAYLPVIGNPQLLWRVFANLPASVRRARGLSDPRVDEALKRHMLVAGSGSYSTDSWYGAEDDVSKAVRNSGLGMRAAANKGLEAGRRALDLLGVVTKALQLSETAVKLASMQYLDAKFPAMPEHIKQRMVQRFGGTPDVLERSMLGSSPAARMALLFYNINKEGVVNAVEAARERPIEQAFKTAVGAMPAIATSMAAYGVFSSMLRELAGAFDDDDDDDDEAQEAKHGLALWADQVADWEAMQKSVPFRDRMLYNATAFAWTDKDQRKVAYVRFLDDPMNGAVRAMTLGALEAAQGRVSVFDALDIGVADQTPNLSPFASLGVALLTGKDAAFGWRNIVSDPRAINSPEGRKQNLKEYAKWTYNNISGGTLGLYRIQPDRDPAAPPPGALEEKLKTAGLGTLASSFVRVSNAGLREQFRKQDAQYEGWQYDNTKLADRWLEMKEAREDIPEEMQKRRREIPPARWEQMLTERRNERNLKSKPLDVQRRKETRNRPREFR